LLGLAAGAHDAAATLLENPRSFDGAADVVRFACATLALMIPLGAAGGLPAGVLRVPLRAFVVAGGTLWLFAWVGVRLHVRFFFGEPLTAPANLAANLALLAAALASAALSGSLMERILRLLLARRGAAAVAVVLALSLIGVLPPARAPEAPVSAAPPPAGARDVLLITLDTTRADHLSCYGYPRGTTPWIDRLARRGRLAPAAYAAIPLTAPSHASMLTGLPPREHGVLNNGMALPETVGTVVEELASQGWNCAAFVGGIPLKAKLSGLDRGFSVYDDSFSALERVHPMLTALAAVRVANRVLPFDLVERRASETCEAARRWLGRSQGPRFLWVHCFDPHTPYDAPAPLRDRFARESPGWTAAGAPVTEWPIADYDAEIRESDRRVGRLAFEFLAVSDSAAVVLTADHGEGLAQHRDLTHGAQLFEEDLRVPFIRSGGSLPSGAIEASELPRQARPEWVRHEVAGLAHLRTDRVTVLHLRPPLAETFAPEGREDRSAVLSGTPDGRVLKLIANRETGEEEVYDLTADPGEHHPLDPMDPRWDDLRALLPPPRDSRHEEPDPETIRKLRALGYIHGE
jgi:hypothetical protein